MSASPFNITLGIIPVSEQSIVCERAYQINPYVYIFVNVIIYGVKSNAN